MCWFLLGLLSLLLVCCKGRNSALAKEAVDELSLKRGDVVLCGRGDKPFGTTAFANSCPEKVKKDFGLAIALLHSFEYDEAEKVFARIIDQEPECAMAYWGVAMSNYHQLWPSPHTEAELKKGARAITVAQSLPKKSKRESDYIEALALFYKDWEKVDHRTRSVRLEKAMEKVYRDYPDDKEAVIFYALALDGAADPADKTFGKQRKAGALLSALYPNEPDHPGVAHYIIHSYDYPELAQLALPAARKYASIAPSSAHAQHMPSHIFTRLGLWDESIHSNLASIAAAQCYAKGAGIKGHWDEELHGMDYLVYAYLQKGENELAQQQWAYLKTIREVYPVNFKVAYAFAAIPARYVLENKMWPEAAGLPLHPANLPWKNFPWQSAINHFARLMGSVHIGDMEAARTELKNLYGSYKALMDQKNVYQANQVGIQIKTAEAWMRLKEGKTDEALQMMHEAADMADKTEKSPVTPGEVLPAKELLADMLLQLNRPREALVAYEADLQTHPGRFNGLYGAARASERLNDRDKARYYYRRLTATANSPHSNRPELERARSFLSQKGL